MVSVEGLTRRQLRKVCKLAIVDGKVPTTDMFLEPPIFKSIKDTIIKNMDKNHATISLFLVLKGKTRTGKVANLFKKFAESFPEETEAQKLVLFSAAIIELKMYGVIRVEGQNYGKLRSFT